MKRVKEQIKYLALLAICLLSGCSDFLDSYNPSAVTDDFYNTKEGQKKLLTCLLYTSPSPRDTR